MESSVPLTGLFLGAGASVELGMPLVWELTEDLREWLTPDKLRSFNQGWRRQGWGKSNAVIDDFVSVLERPEMHYEAVLGYLETQFRRSSPLRGEYQHLYSWLVEMVYHLLRIRHTELAQTIVRNIEWLKGIAKFAEANAPLWIFSLNHDVIVECVAAHYDVRLQTGFNDGVVLFPRRDKTGAKIGDIRAETLTAAQLEAGMVFPQPGTNGINLLKIHGSLDVFTFRNGADMARILPLERSVAGVIEMLRIANDELPFADAGSPTTVKPTNEIAYIDETGKMQFLRRSLLAGAYKFDNHQSQVLPMRILTEFQSNINHVSNLICIGYGFGDFHINRIIRSWLEATSDNHLEIVSPRAEEVPPFLLHLTKQVSVVAETAIDYLDRSTGIVRSGQEKLERRLFAWVRRNRRSEKAKQEFQAFGQKWERRSIEVIMEKLASLPMRDGELDCEAIGGTPDKIAQELASMRSAEYESALAGFLQQIEEKGFL